KLGFTASADPPMPIAAPMLPAMEGWIANAGGLVVATSVTIGVLSPGPVGPAFRMPPLTPDPIATADPDNGSTCVDVKVAVPAAPIFPRMKTDPLTGAATRTPVMF